MPNLPAFETWSFSELHEQRGLKLEEIREVIVDPIVVAQVYASATGIPSELGNALWYVADQPNLDPEECWAALDGNVQRHLVIVGEASPAWLLQAVCFAVHRSALLARISTPVDLRSLATLLQPKFITLFGPIEHLNDNLREQIQGALSVPGSRQKGAFNIIRWPYGFMTGEDVFALSWLVVKNIVWNSTPAQGPKMILPEQIISRIPFFGWGVYLVRSHEDQWQLTGDPERPEYSRYLIVGGSSNEEAAGWNGPMVLCGKHHRPSSPPPETVLPPCEYGAGCSRGETIVPVQNVMTKMAVVLGCNSVRFGYSRVGPTYELAFGFLQGYALAYIGASRFIFVSEHLPLLAHRLLASNMSVGEVVRLLNNTRLHDGYEAPCFELIGDPSLQLGDPSAERPLHIELPGADGYQWSVVPPKTEYLELEVMDEAFRLGVLQNYARLHLTSPVEQGSATELYYSIALEPEINRGRVFVYGWQPLEGERLQGTLQYRPRFGEQATKMLTSTLKYVDASTFAFRLPGETKGLVTELKNRGIQLGRCRARTRYDPFGETAEREVADRIVETIRRIGVIAARDFSTRCRGGLDIAGIYLSESHLVECYTSSCPVCGGVLSRKVYQHAVCRSLQREVAICSNCRLYHDTPANPEVLFVDDGSRVFSSDEPLAMCVKLVNQVDYLCAGAVGIEIWGKTEYTSSPMREFVFLPGEEETYNLQIRPHWKTIPHAVGVVVLAVINAGFYYWACDVFIQRM